MVFRASNHYSLDNFGALSQSLLRFRTFGAYATVSEEAMKLHGKAYAIISGTILLVAAMVIYHAFPGDESEATRLSAIVLIGLSLTVVFMAILAIIYSVLGIENADQALGLPEGSVRALLAFSLVLIFVLLAASLFTAVNKPFNEGAKSLTMVNGMELSNLKNNFIVAAGQATDKDGKLLFEQIPDPTAKTGPPINDFTHPLYNVTYYAKRNQDATDFAKQIFTTLATIFVSVVSFYFGSSVTTSAAAAGVRAAQGTDGDKKSGVLQAALTNALADSHAGQVAVEQASAALKKTQDELSGDPSNPQKQGAVAFAQTVLDTARKDLQAKQAKVQVVQNAVNDSNTRSAGSTGASPNG
jgi:hypothetical protein